MKNVYQAILENVKMKILKSSDRDLFSDQFENVTYNTYAIETPSLDKTQTVVKIDKEIIGFHNAPSGVSFSPGSYMDYAIFQIPIIGNLELFGNIVGNQFYNGSNKYVNGRNFLYKEFSSQPISGNEPLIEQIKERAKNSVNGLETALASFKKVAENFNQNELKNLISEVTASEKEKRNTKSDSENKLNPF
ncbi:hypothetical protein [Flavobacterium sp. UGB4466]|uniref:hypothetical protein n=1 Tax=Flavobacterium sp. UGB4466 TaxID=2730889 RepID=UPI00192C6DA5|nr:hypothetical protein [Flavobacterium sp. UGB4466]